MTLDILRHRFLRFALLAGLGVFLLLAVSLRLAEAAQLATANVDKLNLRSSPNTGSAIVGQANRGDRLTVAGKSGDWYKIQLGKQTAWVASWLITVQDTAVSRGTTTNQGKAAVVSGATLNIRSGPGTNFSIAGNAKKGDRLSILAENGDWYKVQIGSTTGWVANWLVSVQNAPAIQASQPANTVTGSKIAVVTTATLNMRSGPGTNNSIVGKFNQGAKFTVLSQSGDWLKVQSGNTTGWVANWLVTVHTPATATPAPSTPPVTSTGQASRQVAVINADNLNLRGGPGTETSVAGQVSRGVRLPIISRSGDWYQIRQENGTTAWVAGWLVSVVEQPEPPPPDNADYGWLPSPNTGQNNGSGSQLPYVPVAKLVDVQIVERNDVTYINIVSDRAIDFNTFSLTNPNRFVVNLTDVDINNIPETIRGNTRMVDKVRTGIFSEDPYTLRIVLDLNQQARIKANLSPDKKALTLEIAKISYSDSLEGRVIFLDAGHGGYDAGATGKNGVKEKDVNLVTTLKVAEILRQQGAAVIFSRTSDVYVDLYERTRMANEGNADIFVSIHANANTNPAIAGTSTFLYAPSTIPGLFDQKDDRRRLAEDVQRELVNSLGRRDIGVLQSNFAVLRTSLMPSILVETAFLSNNEEELLLATDEFRQRAAEAITRGISLYFAGK